MLKAKPAASGVSAAASAKDPGLLKLADERNTSMVGSFLRASLFTSVISFGVAALVIGIGFLFVLLGFALVKVSTTTVAASLRGTKTGAPAGANA